MAHSLIGVALLVLRAPAALTQEPQPEAVELDAGSASDPVIDAGVDLADLTVPTEQKLSQVERASASHLLEQIRRVFPVTQREEICRALSGRSPASMLIVTSVDLNDEPVDAKVFVDGRELGPTPFHGLVPTCSARLAVHRADTSVEEQLQLAPMASKQLSVRRGGTVRFSGLSAFGDLTVFAEPIALLARGQPQTAYAGGGLRYERWGTLIHGSVGLSAQSLYAPLAQVLLPFPLPVVPALDLFLGVHLRIGGPGEVVALMGFDAGLWQWVHPAGRANLGLRIGPLLLVLSIDVRFLWPFIALPQLAPDGAVAVVGGTLSVGLSW